MADTEIDVLIVGGGLSGLALGRGLSTRDPSIRFRIVEARSRLGGRIVSTMVEGKDSSAAFDLGPAWFWPGQERIAALVRHFELDVFDQYAQGDLVFQDETGARQRGRGMPSQRAHRLVGGLAVLIDALAGELTSKTVLETAAIGIAASNDCMTTRLSTATGDVESITSRCVVLALPPRVAAKTIELEGLEATVLQTMLDIPTWMAGHAKVVAAFEQPFWRDEGLSGYAFSRRGPLVEIHDASSASGGLGALFGFVGVPPSRRRDESALLARAGGQLVELFGEGAARPIALVTKDWAFDPHTAIELDHHPLGSHPAYGLPASLTSLWDGRLILGSTEVAAEFGGYLEGALEAAEQAIPRVVATLV